MIRDRGDDALAVYYALIFILEHPEIRKVILASRVCVHTLPAVCKL